MAKKQPQSNTIEILDSLISIVAACWILVFAYISYFNTSGTLALFTVMPVFILFGLYLIGGAVYSYKEIEILKALEKDTREAESRHRKKAPKLNRFKIIFGIICILCGILLCILL
jgi:hypothetical protein